MKLFSAPLALKTIDGIDHRVVAAPVFTDERPPRGAPGFYDWRLCGRLSRVLQKERFTGAVGDHLLYVLPRRAGATEALLLVGLGDRAHTTPEAIVRAMRIIVEAVPRLGVRDLGIELPGLRASTLPPREVLQWWLREADELFERVTLLVVASDLKAVNAALPAIAKASVARSEFDGKGR